MTPFGEPRSGFVDARWGRLHYVTRGDPGSAAVILIHGMRDHARSWDWIAAALADRFHVIAPDLRGHGDSDWAGPTGYGMAAFVLDLADLVDALALSSAVLVGHSLGGAIALRYAGAFPDRVRLLAVIEAIELPIVRDQRRLPKAFPTRLRDWIGDEQARRSREPRSYADHAEAAARMTAAQPVLDAGTIAHLALHGSTVGPDGRVRWKYDNAARYRPPDDADARDLDETLAAIACPILLAYGEASWIPLPPAARLGLIRDHRVITFPDASHWLHHQSRAAFLAALESFLEGPAHA